MTRLQTATPNALLFSRRIERGWSQARLVSQLRSVAAERGSELPAASTLIQQVSRWENGHKEPSDFYRDLLRRVYHCSDRDLGFARVRDVVRPRPQDEVEVIPPGSPGNEPPGMRLSMALARASRVDALVVDDLRELVDGYRRMDRRFGSRPVFAGLGSLLDQALKLGEHSMRLDHRMALAGVAGDTSTLMGWLALDANRTDDAWTHFRRGAQAAREAEDPFLLAFALGESAYALMQLGWMTDAVTVLDEAETQLGGRSAPQLRVWLQGARAEVLAAMGDIDGCRRSLDHAYQGLDAGPDDPLIAPYLSYLDDAHLARWAGCCLAQLGRPDAATLLEQALTSADPSFVRAQAGLLVDLATAHAASGDLELSCQVATEAVRLAIETGSARQLKRIGALRPRLVAATGTDAHVALLDQLGDAGRARLSRAIT